MDYGYLSFLLLFVTLVIKANLATKPFGDRQHQFDVAEPYGKAMKLKASRDLTPYYNQRPINDVVLELQQKMEIENIDSHTSLRYFDINRSCSTLPC